MARRTATDTTPALPRPARTEPKAKRARGLANKPQEVRGDGATDIKVRGDGTPGNSRIDREWLEAHATELRPIDEDEAVPFGVRLQWSGTVDDENYGSAFYIPDQGSRCIGTAYVRDEEGRHVIDKDGLTLLRPCLGWRMRGMTVCGKHGGLTDAGLGAARRRLAAAADPAVGHLLAIAFDKKLEPADRIRALNSVLDRAGLRAGMEISVETPGWQKILKEMFEGGALAGTEEG